MYRPLSVVFALLTSLAFTAVAAGQPAAQALIPPIQEIKNVKPKPLVFKVAKRNKPIAIRTEKDAANYFAKDALATLKKKVDFSKQFVLVFAWRGSGQDRLTYVVAESFPEQIFFRIKPGFTRDLRPHVHVYALRSNVKWSVRKR